MQVKPQVYRQEDSPQDRYLSFAVCFQVTIVGIKNALVQAVPMLYDMNESLNMMLLVIIGLLYVSVIFKAANRFERPRVNVFLVLIIVFFSLLFSSLRFPENGSIIMDWMPRMLPYCFVTFFLLAELNTFYWLEFYMTRFCYATIVFSLISAFYIYRNGHITISTWSSYSMPLSYVTLVAVMWLLYKFFQKETLRDFLFILVGIIVIIAYGSRNPLLAILSYIVIQIIRNVNNGRAKGWKRILYFLGSILIAACFFLWRLIIFALLQISGTFSITSRTLELLSQSEISSSGRDEIHASLWDLVNQYPILGLGAGGDVRLIDESAHGLYLSIFTSYGYIFGSIFILAILYVCIKAFTSSFGRNKEIVLLYMCMVFPRGFTGGDVWTSDVFWWMLGICLTSLSLAKMQQYRTEIETA